MIWLSVNFDVFMQNLLRFSLRENSTFELSYLLGGLQEKVRGQFSVREWFKKIIDAIDAILDSLIDAACGTGGLIKEFKDALGALA